MCVCGSVGPGGSYYDKRGRHPCAEGRRKRGKSGDAEPEVVIRERGSRMLVRDLGSV